MKKFYFTLLGICFYLSANAQPSLTYLNHYSLTPNNQDTLGVFCRVFYHPGREKFYTVYAGRVAGSSDPIGHMAYFTWREYDTNFVFTNNFGTLSNHSSAGDFAMVQVGTDYYHLTTGPSHSYKLSKYDEDFNLIKDTILTIDAHDSNTDQLMNYTNGRLVIGAFHEESATPPSFPMQNAWTPHMHKFEFDLNLHPLVVDTHLSETFYSWGGNCIYNNNQYNIVTLDSFPLYNLNVYKYDVNWNYQGYTNLNNDGQWSQGILWDGTYYYVSYHTGHEHRSGNITISIYDINWNEIYTTTITSNNTYPPPLGPGENANRPVLLRVGNKLYVSYDVESYNYTSGPPFFDMNFDWQSHVQVFQVTQLQGIETNSSQVEFKIFPNPVKTAFNFHMNESIDALPQLYIYNAMGQLVKTCQIVNGSNTIHVENFPAGVYDVQYIKDHTKYHAKLVKTE